MNTTFLLSLQHDYQIARPFDVANLLRTMLTVPVVRHVGKVGLQAAAEEVLREISVPGTPRWRQKVTRVLINERDPFVQFLLNGGFIYFDFQYEICAINSVGFEASDEYDTAFGTSAIFFAQPAHISPTCMAELDRLERWWPVTVSDVQDSGGLVYFAWILPSEYVGDMIFPPLGGFAYLTGTQGFFYPVAVDGMRGDAAS